MQLLVTLALFTLLLRSTTWEKAVQMWQQFDAGYLAAAIGFITISTTMGAIALLVLFELKGHPAWWARFTVDYFYVQALCLLTPAQAAEAALPYIAGRERFAPGEIAACLLIQRMIALGIIVLVAVAGAGRWATPALLWGAAGLVLLACLTAIAIIGTASVRTRLNEFVTRHFGSILFGFYDTWTSVFRDRQGRLLTHVLLMICRFFIGVGSIYATLMAFDVTVPFWEMSALAALATLSVLVPISINGLGVVEGIFVIGLADYGYGTEQVLAACLAGRVLSILTLLVWSALYFFLRWRDGPWLLKRRESR